MANETNIKDLTEMQKLDAKPIPDHERPLVLLSLLEDIVRGTHYLLDDCETVVADDGSETSTVEKCHLDKLNEAFDQTDLVPDIDDNSLRPGWKTVIDRLENLIVTQMQPKHEDDHNITEARLIDLMEGLGAGEDVEDVMRIFRNAGISEPTIVKTITRLVPHPIARDRDLQAMTINQLAAALDFGCLDAAVHDALVKLVLLKD